MGEQSAQLEGAMGMRLRIRSWRMIVLAILLMEGAFAPLAAGNSVHASATPPAAGPPKHTRAPSASPVAFRGAAMAMAKATIGAPATTPPAFASSPRGTAAPSGASAATLQRAYGKLPLSFELNQGQTDGQVKALARGAGYTLFLTNAGTTLALVKRQTPTTPTGLSPHVAQSHARTHGQSLPLGRLGDLLTQHKGDKVTESAVRLNFVGANPHPQVVGLDKLPGMSNYFIGKDRRRWRTNVAHYAKIEYKNVYPGVSLIYYGNQDQLEYDWIIAPETDPHVIQFFVTGPQQSSIDKHGDLVLRTKAGDVLQRSPVTYQETGGVRHGVSGRFELGQGGHVRFHIGRYNAHRPLIIDPVLTYSTYLGGSADDGAYGVAVDAAGDAYVVGWTSSANFPVSNAVQGTFGGSGSPYYGDGWGDVVVVKLNATGTVLVYSTYIGGSGDDVGRSIAVDGSGNVYITGWTDSTNFPTVNAIQGIYGGRPSPSTYDSAGDAFVAELNTIGNALLYSTYLVVRQGFFEQMTAPD